MPILSNPPARHSEDARTNAGSSPVVTAPGFQLRPLQVTWEMTQACDWKSAPARAARASRERQHFSTAEAFHLVEEIAAMHVPLLALTGGDPLLRTDLFPVVAYASGRSVR